ncbi:hypothetical protein OG455_41780 [Kitasatospora sp. NBC_01287]|uniref:hypothetical protein n=1 Tax=Kitasatospora sp. NBC_01287 TaxID=2903573 RepID=UPI00224D5218|nr:hypothetical protein [Kitasatospora sp. NBC_01287]MCX4751733.1 hypothetical protein [Kitasatospora sp. NBC_01287]MCX4751975.1 hypothetical protein [Kitasatospora sp. NBC_01287]
MAELYRRVDGRRRERGLSWRRLAAELGLSASTLVRMGGGGAPDADALVTLLVWLDLDAGITGLVLPTGGQS